MTAARFLPVTAAVLLAACGSGKQPDDPLAERDPAVTAALADPLMADPDLTSQNRGNAALTGGGPAAGEIPPPKRGDAEIAAAQSAALALAGGRLTAAPQPIAREKLSPAVAAGTAEGLVRSLPWAKSCAGKLSYTAGWAAKLPAALPVYPRGHVQEAAGSDDAGCTLRVVHFQTPVPPGDVLDFYYTMARKAGLAVQSGEAGPDRVLTGSKGAARFALFVRQSAGMTEADLVTSD